MQIPQQTYASYECGRSFPKDELLHKIVVEFNATSDWLLGLEKYDPSYPSKKITQEQSKDIQIKTWQKQYIKLNAEIVTLNNIIHILRTALYKVGYETEIKINPADPDTLQVLPSSVTVTPKAPSSAKGGKPVLTVPSDEVSASREPSSRRNRVAV